MTQFSKDPAAKLDYLCDWSEWLGYASITAGVLLAALDRVEAGEDAAAVYADIVNGDTIETSTWVVVPEGITKSDETKDDTSSRVWVTGGEVGTRYSVTNHIVTAGGREDERTITVYVEER